MIDVNTLAVVVAVVVPFAVGLGGWALTQAVKSGRDLAALGATVTSERKATTTRFEDLTDRMVRIEHKLDKVLEGKG